MTASWIVILNWNGKDDTLDLLASLQGADLADTTVLVVDNDSSDGTLSAVAALHPWVRTLQTGANLGYAGGNNRGIAYALSGGADVIGVINNDVLVSPTFWQPLVDVASSGRVAVCPDIRYAADPDRTWYFGAAFDSHLAVPRHLSAHEQPDRSDIAATELLTGCCLVATAETWRAVGGFDEGLFLIFEDSDWSLRATGRGVRLVVQPASVVRHKVSRSFHGPDAGLGLYYYCRNGAVFAARWFGLSTAVTFAVRTVLVDGLRRLKTDGRLAIRPLLVRLAALVAAALGSRGPAGGFVRWLATGRVKAGR